MSLQPYGATMNHEPKAYGVMSFDDMTFALLSELVFTWLSFNKHPDKADKAGLAIADDFNTAMAQAVAHMARVLGP